MTFCLNDCRIQSMQDYWQRQSDKPLFPDILWSRPETKSGAGKLLIIGGNKFALGAPGIAYNTATESGVGTTKVIMPESVKQTVKLVMPDADFAPSNPSGSFSKLALSDLLSNSYWADMVLLSGDLGRNSETAVLFENYIQKYPGPLTVTQDAVDYFTSELSNKLLNRPNTLIVLSLAQLQKTFINYPRMTPITYGMQLPQLVQDLHDLTLEVPSTFIVKHNDILLVSHKGNVVTTSYTDKIWRIKTASRASVFWLQNLDKPLESIVSSILATSNN